MRYLVLYVLMFFARDVFSAETTICLMNKTQSSHHIEVANIQNYDWEGGNRPDHNFNDITIEPGQTICRWEDINGNATPRFTFVIDGIPTRMSYMPIHTVRAWGAYSVPSPGVRTNLWGQSTGWSYPWNLYRAYLCDGGGCSLFEIR